MDLARTVPIQKNVLLLGAGNAHLGFVRMFGMNPMPGVAITLVSEASIIPYSAMVPGHIGREYSWNDITFDLVRLCRWANVRFLAARAIDIDPVRKKVRFASRPELSYDVLSLGMGSVPACPPGLIGLASHWPMRPLHVFVDKLNALERRLRETRVPHHLVIVGGGASGCELTASLQKRFAGVPGFRITLVDGDTRLLSQFPEKAGRSFADLFQARGVDVRLSARVTGGDDASLEINNAERLPYDTVLWATNAAAHAIVRASGLPLTTDGFLKVNDNLQSIGDPSVFGTGDCATMQSHPRLHKNGVYAVRQGKTLFENVRRFVVNKPLTPFRPQSIFLCLMNTSDEAALFVYGPLVWKSRFARRLKDRIDRAWVEKFTRLAPMVGPTSEADDDPRMRCGGCGNKVAGDVLSAVLRRIAVPDDPRVLLGVRAGEDASVHRMKPELFSDQPDRLLEVQTVDYFKTFTDDPYLFGRISAIAAVSDLFAMNARPFSALAIATLPYARGPVQEAMLFEMMSGAIESLKQFGVVLTGGHTTEGAELALGFALTGYAEEGTLFQKSKLKPGDKLILTKPVGSGAILAAWMRGQCSADWHDRLVRAMLNANAAGAEVLRRFGVQACTDVTGFGLGGHLLEMLDASDCAARLDAVKVPIYVGFEEVVRLGIVSTLHRDNAKSAGRVESVGDAPAWLFDPQTSGGLLAGVRADVAAEVVAAMRDAGYAEASIIGEVLPLKTGETPRIFV